MGYQYKKNFFSFLLAYGSVLILFWGVLFLIGGKTQPVFIGFFTLPVLLIGVLTFWIVYRNIEKYAQRVDASWPVSLLFLVAGSGIILSIFEGLFVRMLLWWFGREFVYVLAFGGEQVALITAVSGFILGNVFGIRLLQQIHKKPDEGSAVAVQWPRQLFVACAIAYVVIGLLWMALLYPLGTYIYYPHSAFYFWTITLIAGFLIFFFSYWRATGHTLKRKSYIATFVYAVSVSFILCFVVSIPLYSFFSEVFYEDAVRLYGEGNAYRDDPILKTVAATTRTDAIETLVTNLMIFVGFVTVYSGSTTVLFIHRHRQSLRTVG